jgi:hypothetical protein
VGQILRFLFQLLENFAFFPFPSAALLLQWGETAGNHLKDSYSMTQTPTGPSRLGSRIRELMIFSFPFSPFSLFAFSPVF